MKPPLPPLASRRRTAILGGPAPEKAARPPYTVVRDTREHAGKGWMFEPSARCAGTVLRALKTGDYTIEGCEGSLTIDRKGSATEFVGNLYQKRFEAELARMATFEYAAIVLEFEFDEIARWHGRHPKIRKVPRHWKIPGAILARFVQIRLKYPHVDFVFAGAEGQAYASSLFKRFHERPKAA